MLSELKILDFSLLLPGPYATMMFADLGASVIQIVRPSETTLFKVPSHIARTLSRNKKILPFDLKDKNSIMKIKKLIMEYDIIVEGFRPGVMEKLGLGYNQLKEINPKIIYCSITGFGQNGEYANRAGHDINYQAYSGITSLLHHKRSQNTDMEAPGLLIGDTFGGSYHLAIGLLSAYISRFKEGKGTHVDISMTDGLHMLGIIPITNYLDLGSTQMTGLLFGDGQYDYYRTKDDRFLSIGVLESKFFDKLLSTLNIQMNDIMVEQTENQSIDYPKLKEIISDKIISKTASEWDAVFKDRDVCVEIVKTIDEVHEDKHFKSRGNVIEINSEKRIIKQLAHPIKYSNYEPTYKLSERINSEDV